MKKFLIGTTALVAAGFASSAYSAAIEASVNGYMNLGVAFSSAKNADKQASSAFTGTTSVLENDDIHVIRDGEIHFNVKGTSDNGLTFKARVELEAFVTTDQLDENWASIGGSFGEVMIGGNDTALYQVAGKYGVSYVNGAINYADSANTTTEFTPGSGIEPFGQDDSIGIQYTTPSFSGFKVGVSFQPDSAVRTISSVGGSISTANRSDGTADAQSTFGKRGPDQYSAALAYDGKFGGVSLGAGLGYMQTGKTVNNTALSTVVTAYDIGQTDTVYAGLDVGYSGFTVSGFYQQAKTKAKFYTNSSTIGTVSGTYSKTDTFGLGLMYQTGPWTVGGGVATETTKLNSINSTLDIDNNKATKMHGTAGVSYALAPGATVAGIIEAGNLKNDTTTIATGVKTSTKTSGVAGAVLFGLKF